MIVPLAIVPSPNCNAPPATSVPPSYVLVPDSVTVPALIFCNGPVPVIGPLIVWATPAAVETIPVPFNMTGPDQLLCVAAPLLEAYSVALFESAKAHAIG